jgi:hypothetical protein
VYRQRKIPHGDQDTEKIILKWILGNRNVIIRNGRIIKHPFVELTIS